VALHKTLSTRRLHRISIRRSSLGRPPGATGHEKCASEPRRPILSFAGYSTASNIRSPPTPAMSIQACDTDLIRPHEYTTGRWLRNDRLQRDARHLEFDFAALSAKAVALCPRARSISSCTKVEGGFNKAFLYTMDSGECIVARVPTRIAGPQRLTTNSEVATIAYSERLSHCWFRSLVF
jgi:hypothetical protein